MKKVSRWAVASMIGAILGPVALAQSVDKPLKVEIGRPSGQSQTSTSVSDPQVDGKILRVVVGPAERGSHAMLKAGIGEKLKQGDRIKATLWLRGTPVEAGRKPMVQIGVQEAADPWTALTKSKRVELTDRLVAYTVEATIPRDMPKSTVTVVVQMGFLPQTIDMAAIQAVKLPAEKAS